MKHFCHRTACVVSGDKCFILDKKRSYSTKKYHTGQNSFIPKLSMRAAALSRPLGRKMVRQRYGFDEAKIKRFRKEGRGQGRGAEYRPWLTVRDVPSRRRSHRLHGLTADRVHHLLSDI